MIIYPPQVPVAPDGTGSNGEAGSSPALSRNCKNSSQGYIVSVYRLSQAARLSWASRTFAVKGVVR